MAATSRGDSAEADSAGFWFSSDTKGHICMWDSSCQMRLKHSLGSFAPKMGIGYMGERPTKVVTSMVLLGAGRAAAGQALLCGKSDGNIQLFSVTTTTATQGGGGANPDLKSEWEVDHAHRDARVSAVTCDPDSGASCCLGDARAQDFVYHGGALVFVHKFFLLSWKPAGR